MGAIGAGERSRTYDLRITNALLYQLSYTGTLSALRFGTVTAWIREYMLDHEQNLLRSP